MSKKIENISKQSSDTKLEQTRVRKEKQTKDDATRKAQDEKLRRGPYTVSTPRSFGQKTSTADIYGQGRKSVATAKAPRKTPSTSYLSSGQGNSSPMRDILKSSPSSSSHISSSRESKPKMLAKRPEATPRTKEFSVTVNTPLAKRKLNLDLEREKSFVKEPHRGQSEKKPDRLQSQIDLNRPRTKTRTLADDEVKILTAELVDNNAEMLNLSKRLAAKPKAFFVDLDGDQKKGPSTTVAKEPSDDEVSYEDDFESYESDFDSYHSSSPGEENDDEKESDGLVDNNKAEIYDFSEAGSKEIRDEENMLDSGNFDLRDQRSANKSKPVIMDFIQEASEGLEDKKSSLTDEGFQEMSSSSAVSSMKAIEVLDRPLFMNFAKSKENKRKKKINDRLKQRAKDLLSIITLHEMYYSLFEMKPISYDLYMTTFGRANYTQVAIQTFDDGITEEVQTDEIETEQKWTQYPVEFTKNEICFSNKIESRKYSKNTEDYLTKFTFLMIPTSTVEINDTLDENYKSNQLRIYLEQKDGVGPSEMLPYETYKSKLKITEYNTSRLGKFLKRMERKISQVLNKNNGDSDLTNLIKSTKLPFSKGYISVSTDCLVDDKLLFLKNTKISLVCFSKTKSNLLMTVHKLMQKVTTKRCFACLWDLGVTRSDPLKVLTTIDDVVIGRLKGAADGFFVAALRDGSIHLWDLSEEPTCRDEIASEEKNSILVESHSENVDIKDGEWKSRNTSRNVHCALHAGAYTSSAHNMSNVLSVDRIVGVELTTDSSGLRKDSGCRVLGQVVTLHRTGVIAIWSIVQEKSKTVPPDIGKAYWSKTKLERNQTINILDYVDIPLTSLQNGNTNFNLNAAKKRLSHRKRERSILKKEFSRPKSALRTDLDFDIDRPSSAASAKSKMMLSLERNVAEKWESGLVCYDLKLLPWKNVDSYLIAKNSGEVLCVKRFLGVIKVERFCVAPDLSSVSCLEVSPHGLPYYLAATDSGTVNLCSLLHNRVLLTLDCRNIPRQEVDKCQADHRGRFVSSSKSRDSGKTADLRLGEKLAVTSVSWSRVNPCRLLVSLLGGTVVSWDLTRSDIYAESALQDAASLCVASDTSMALVNPAGEVQVHRLANDHRRIEYLQIFEKYVALL